MLSHLMQPSSESALQAAHVAACCAGPWCCSPAAAARLSFYLRAPSGGNVSLWVAVDDQV